MMNAQHLSDWRQHSYHAYSTKHIHFYHRDSNCLIHAERMQHGGETRRIEHMVYTSRAASRMSTTAS
ncbi:hypothetical protein ACM14_19270 [Delftia sp. JD2]|nr:hypothetical protein ACM14_19270 [Delftia sp. JD2]